MFDSLFGGSTPPAMRFFIAFVVVFALIGATAWLVRRFGGKALGAQNMRGRQPRLAVVDATPIDARRRLLLIRRDNVEHLVLIGGGSDVVVETNIERGRSSARDSARTNTASESRNAAPAESFTPEPAPTARVARRAAVSEDTTQWPIPAEPGRPRTPILPQAIPPQAAPPQQPAQSYDPISSLAAELGRQMNEAPARNDPPRPAPIPPRAAQPQTQAQPAKPRPAPMPPQAKPATAPAQNNPPKAMPPQPAAPAIAQNANPDQNLADMAQRLESLRRPTSPEPAREAMRPAASNAPRPAAPPPPAPMSEPQPKSAPDDNARSLEQEMASLLGRPASRSG